MESSLTTVSLGGWDREEGWRIPFIHGWCVVGPFRGQGQIVDSAAIVE